MIKKYFSLKEVLVAGFKIFGQHLFFIISFAAIGSLCVVAVLWLDVLILARIGSGVVLNIPIIALILSCIKILVESFIRLGVVRMCLDIYYQQKSSYSRIIDSYVYFLPYVTGKILVGIFFATIAILLVSIFIGMGVIIEQMMIHIPMKETLRTVFALFIFVFYLFIVVTLGFFDLFIINKHYSPYNALKASYYLTKGAVGRLICLGLMQSIIVSLIIGLVLGNYDLSPDHIIMYNNLDVGNAIIGRQSLITIIATGINIIFMNPYVDLVRIHIYHRLLSQTTLPPELSQ